MCSLKTTWDELHVGLEEVFEGQFIDQHRFIAFYTLIYNHCAGATETTNSRDQFERLGTEFNGGRLYHQIREYLVGKMGRVYEEISGKKGADLIDFYLKQWTVYRLAFGVIDGMCMYLNKHWVPRRMQRQPGSAHYIKELCLSIWSTEVFEKISDQLIHQLVKMFMSELEESPLDQELSKTLIDSFVELRLTRVDLIRGVPTEMEHDVRQEYMIQIQDVYVQESEKRYFEKDDHLLGSLDFPEYLEQVSNFLDQEIQRYNHHFPNMDRTSFLIIISEVFIQRHLDLYKENFVPLLEQGTKEDIHSLYTICVRSKAAMVIIKEIEHKYIEDLAGKYSKDPRGLMEEIMCGPAFKFIDAHNKVFTSYVKFPVPRILGDISSRLAVLTARHCDYLLKRSKIGDTELDAQLQTTLALVNYIDDKDVFQRTYSKLLARRLLDDNLAAESSEKQLVVQLRDLCGLEYANRLQKMLTDIELSKDLSDSFNEKCKSDEVGLKMNFSAAILSSSVWSMTPSIEIQIPKILQETVKWFTDFYDEKHHSRKLIWVHSHSQGELLTNYLKKPYILQAWTSQVTILMSYNDIKESNISLEGIIDRLEVKKEAVIPILGSLMKAEILKSDLDSTVDLDITIPETTKFHLNSNFASKKLRVDLTKVQIASETKKESQKDQELIEEDRRIQIEACVVRIMKTRKRLAHNELISEVISQLSSRFTPNMPKIRMAIENLIERLFLKRDDESMNIYEYNA